MSRTEAKLDSAEAIETRTRCQLHGTGRKSIGCTDRFPAAQMCLARLWLKSVCIPSIDSDRSNPLGIFASDIVTIAMLKSHFACFCPK